MWPSRDVRRVRVAQRDAAHSADEEPFGERVICEAAGVLVGVVTAWGGKRLEAGAEGRAQNDCTMIDPKSVTVAPFLSLKSRYRSYALAVASSSPFAFSRAISSALWRRVEGWRGVEG